MTAKPIFQFLRSRGARLACPFCGHEDWHGWDERITLDHATGSESVDRHGEAVLALVADQRVDVVAGE